MHCLPKTILLVDDMKSDNYLSSRVMRKVCPDCGITTRQGGQEALDYLNGEGTGQRQFPDLILLDINMPRVSGWDFLDRFKLLPEAVRKRTVVCMLTTSRSQEDRQKAARYPIIKKFLTKPLTMDAAREALTVYASTMEARSAG